MSKSASELEEDLDELLHACSLSARGLFAEMRILIEKESKRYRRKTGEPFPRPGHLHWNNKPMSDGQLANLAGCSSAEVSSSLQELLDAEIVMRAGQSLHSPLLTKIAERRQRHADVMDRSRRRAEGPGRAGGAAVGAGVSRDTPCDTPCDPPRDPGPAGGVSPASSSLPTTLSPTPPTSPDLDPRGAERRRGELGSGPTGTADHPVAVMPKRQGGTRAEIEAIYQAYPRKVGKGYAIKAIDNALVSLRRRGPTADGGEAWTSWLLGRVRAFAAATDRRIAADPASRNYIKHPATWFNGGCYDDDPAEWEPTTRKDVKHGNGHTRRPTAAERGEFQQPAAGGPPLRIFGQDQPRRGGAGAAAGGGDRPAEPEKVGA